MIISHDNPVRESNAIVRADLSSHGMPGRFEQFWVKRVKDREFEVCCVPFFVYGIALGDIVHTDNEFTIDRVVKRCGHSTLRVAVANGARLEVLHGALRDWLRTVGVGLLHEWHAPGYLAVDLPDTPDQYSFRLFEDMKSAGDIEFEVDTAGQLR